MREAQCVPGRGRVEHARSSFRAGSTLARSIDRMRTGGAGRGDDRRVESRAFAFALPRACRPGSHERRWRDRRRLRLVECYVGSEDGIDRRGVTNEAWRRQSARARAMERGRRRSHRERRRRGCWSTSRQLRQLASLVRRAGSTARATSSTSDPTAVLGGDRTSARGDARAVARGRRRHRRHVTACSTRHARLPVAEAGGEEALFARRTSRSSTVGHRTGRCLPRNCATGARRTLPPDRSRSRCAPTLASGSTTRAARAGDVRRARRVDAGHGASRALPVPEPPDTAAR